MTTTTCDMCGKLIDEHSIYVWHRRSLHNEPMHFDLCGDCDGEVQTFMVSLTLRNE